MVIIICRISIDGIPHRRTHSSLNGSEEALIGAKSTFFFIIESIESHILQSTCILGGSKSIGDRTRSRYLSPLCCRITLRTIYRHTTFVELLSVTKHVFRHFAKVQIEVSSILMCIGLPLGIDKRIQQPKFNILNVSLLKVIGVKLSHQSSPMFHWIRKQTVTIKVGIKVIRATLIRVISKIKNTQC